MQNPIVTYFDFPGSRGEEIRMALVMAGVEFEDNRVNREAFMALKPSLPFGAVPTFEADGLGVISQTNAILRLIGREYELYPLDPFIAARHDAFMEAAEDVRHRMGPSMRMKDGPEKTAARKELAEVYLPMWARGIEGMLDTGPEDFGPFVDGDMPGIADIKLYMIDRWISSGAVDLVPATTFDNAPRLKALAKAFGELSKIVEWNKKWV
jgi:glutathione S-transferase